MRKVIVTEFVTLDGVMQAPGGADEDRRSNFEHGGWSGQFWNEEATKYKFDELFAVDAFLLGRVTCEIFAGAWPSSTDEEGFADRMNSLPKFVVSTTLEKVEWNNARLITENVAAEVTKLKHQPGQDILIYGSATLVQSLMQTDLIDEYRLMVFPIVLGSGKHLFKDGSDLKRLKLVDSKITGTGVVILTYQPDKK